MSIVADYHARPEAVGEILVKVQDDLLQLKEKIISNGELRNLDLSALENAISKTEDGLKSHTEIVLQQLNNRVNTLPAREAQGHGNAQVSMEATWDLQTGSKGSFAVRQQESRARPKLDGKSSALVFHRKAVADRKAHAQPDFKGPSPGQQMKENFVSRAVHNPYNVKNREVANENYGIQLPLIADRKAKFSTQQLMKGSTVEPLAVLPKANRVDPQLLPPPITEDDAMKGILSLIDRGLIPPAAQLTLEPSPVRHKMAPLHDPKEKDGPKLPPKVGDQFGAIRLDACKASAERVASPPKSASPTKFPPSVDAKSRASSGRYTSATKLKTPVTVRTLELQPMDTDSNTGTDSTVPPPTTPASGQDFKDKNHRFAVQNGKTREHSQEYMAFKHHYCLSWGSIVTTLKHLEKMLTNFAVPIAFIHGDKLADLAIEFELEKPPTIEDLLTVIVNREDVENLINRPGRRFVGPNGEDCAAARIQATWRMYEERGRYLEYRRKKWAAGVICISWVMNVKMSKVRKQLAATRLDQLEGFRKQARIFSKSWSRMQQSRRTIIHIPSLGYSTPIRDSLDNLYVWQNMQMSRLCDIKDPNVDVIFVSPVHINEEMQQYYSKLLGLKSAIETGNVDDQVDPVDRYKIIVPDALKAFPAHNMCLASILKYSPRTLKRIKNLIRGKDAYIVTGVPHKDDVHIAEVLGVPILSPEPEIAHLYSTKSGSKRIFASARVAIPPGEYDVYSLPQLQECLTQLITENLEVTRWLFKLDSEFDGRGIAYVDVVENLKCYPWALKEAARYGEKWSKKWAQEAAYIKIHAEIPDVLAEHATPVNTKVYPTWEKFLDAFLSQGGVIEACPPSESITALTVDMLVEPDGKVRIVSAGDQIHADSQFSCWGMSVPQSSVEPDELNDTCNKIGESCKARGVIGYFSVDFVTFIHPKSMQQVLWAVDLSLSYSDSLAMFNLMRFTTGGTFDPKNHFFDVPIPRREEKKSRRKRLKESSEAVTFANASFMSSPSFHLSAQSFAPPNTNRYAVMSTRLRHTNLSVVHYSVFFQMCRAHGIGYDIKEKQGTVFTLIDSFNRENMGMLSVGDNLQGALATFARNLSVIHQEISAPNMQGESNFRPVIEDIEAILGTTVQNSEDKGMDVESTELVESGTPT